MDTSALSTMPEFIKGKRITADGHHWTVIVCPRCKATFHVSYGAWSERDWAELSVDTRPCPYCFAASWLPGLKPAPPVEKVRPRTIKRRKKK